MGQPFRVIAHRGASSHAPENTLPAFALAVQEGAREVELDVRFSSDDEIIVFHDDALDRKTDRKGRVRHYSGAELRRSEIGTWFHRSHPEIADDYRGTSLVGLADVFALLGERVRYHVEIKGFEDWLPLRVLEQIDLAGLRDHVTVTSFSMRPLEKFRSIAPDVPICFLLRDSHDALRSAEFRPELEGRSADDIQAYWIEATATAGFQQVGVRAADATARTRACAEAAGVDVRGWGVGDLDALQRLVDVGAIGATVDWPGRAIEALR